MIVPHKTLVIRFSSIGDVVLTSPMLRLLRRRLPDAQIDFLTKAEYAELVRFNPNLNVTFEYRSSDPLGPLIRRLTDERYDLVVDLHNSLRSRIVRTRIAPGTWVTINKRVLRRALLVQGKINLYRSIVPVADRYIEPLAGLGITPDGGGPELHIPDETLFAVSGRMASLQLNRFERVIGLCPSARHDTKRWPADRFAALGIAMANAFAAKILVFGGAADKDLCAGVVRSVNEAAGPGRATDLSGSLSLLETGAAMQFCDVVVTNDSGLMHIASAMQRKVVAIFGPTVREFGFFPWGSDASVLEVGDLYCRPCSHVGKDRCPEGHFRCMRDIGVDAVASRVASVLPST